ncbi:MAG: hypothetical protein MRZ79_12255 [Bacteroidia bacterium]|nr:hypothetical protein [Bacteroidia bacterium]
MRELVFRDPQKGSVVIRSRQAGLSSFASNIKFEVEGIPLQKNSFHSSQNAFFATHQDFDFIFIKGKDKPKPPFRFVIRNQKDIVLNTPALNDKIFMAQWNSQQWVGEMHLILIDGNEELIWGLQTEVVPPNLPYKKEQNHMVSELENWMLGLSRSISKPLSHVYQRSIPWFKIDWKIEVSEEKSLDEFYEASHFLEQHIEEEWHFSHKWLKNVPNKQFRQKVFRKSHQNRIWAAEKTRSRNIHLNRWVLHNLKVLRSSLGNIYQDIKLKSFLDSFLHRNFSEISPAQHLTVPNHLPIAYRRWYACFLPLLKRSSVRLLLKNKDSLKDLPQLYESWAFLKVAALIGELTAGQLSYQNLLQFEQGKGISRLSHGQQIRFTYELTDGESTIDIWYQREVSTSSGKQKPDIWLEINRKHFNTPFIFLMDMKFQVKATSQDKDGGFVAPREALNQLHRYRDALIPQLIHLPEGAIAQKALGGAILFPYPGEQEKFRTSEQFLQLRKEGIGAIPLYPSSYSNNELLREWLDEILNAPGEALFERMVNYDKREQHLSIERFSQYIKTNDTNNRITGFWNENRRGWETDEFIALNGEGVIPEECSIGALDAALRYGLLHLLWTPSYLGLRLWQETVKIDSNAYWDKNGLVFKLKGIRYLVTFDQTIIVRFLGNEFSIEQSKSAEEILEIIKKAS